MKRSNLIIMAVLLVSLLIFFFENYFVHNAFVGEGIYNECLIEYGKSECFNGTRWIGVFNPRASVVDNVTFILDDNEFLNKGPFLPSKSYPLTMGSCKNETLSAAHKKMQISWCCSSNCIKLPLIEEGSPGDD